MIKKIIVLIVSIVILTTGAVVFSDEVNGEENCYINLPDYEILMTQTYPNPPYSFFNVSFEGIGEGYDVQDNPKNYLGWCIDHGTSLPMSGNPYTVKLYSSYCPPVKFLNHKYDDGEPSDVAIPINWGAVNWVINHKQGNYMEIEAAVRHFANLGPNTNPPGSQYYDAMIADAMENSEGFVPGCGDVIAVIVDNNLEIDINDPAYLYHRNQYLIIEVPIPCNYEGLTPGFWKNKGVKVGWPSPYNTEMTLEQASFIIPDDSMIDNPKRPVYPDDTLLEALKYEGGEKLSGMAQNLFRAATAALLNAAHSEVNYPLSVGEVINLVNGVLTEDRDSMEQVKNQLDTYNNLKADEWW